MPRNRRALSLDDRRARMDAYTDQDLAEMRAADRAKVAHRADRGPELTPEQESRHRQYETWKADRRVLAANGQDLPPRATPERSPERSPEQYRPAWAAYQDYEAIGLTRDEMARLRGVQRESVDRAFQRYAGEPAAQAWGVWDQGVDLSPIEHDAPIRGGRVSEMAR